MPDAVMPGRLNAEQEKHWQDCALCQRRVSRAAGAIDAFDDASDEEFAAAVAGRLADSVLPVAARLPETVARGLFGPVTLTDVEADQVWQLQWRSKACLVAVIAVRGWHATVAPLTTDVHLAGGDTVVLDASSSPLQVPTAVWLSAAATVPLAAFAREIGAFAQLGAGTLGQALRTLRQSGEVGDCAPHGVAGQEHGVDTLELVDAVQASLAWFSSADRALTDTLERSVASSEGLDVVSLLRSLSSDQLGEAGVTKGELLPVLRGEPLTDVQAAALAPVLGVEAAALRSDSAVPEALIREASSPRWFTPRRAFYKANDLTDEEGLLAVTHKAQFALAARSVLPTDTTDWRAKVAYVLSDYLASSDE